MGRILEDLQQDSHWHINPWIVLLAATAFIPLTASSLLQFFLVGWYWVNEPVHAALEAWGALTALTVSALLFAGERPLGHNARINIIASALLASGLLDAVHACLHQGSAFVWTRSLSTMAGGAIFALIWLPERFETTSLSGKLLPFATGLTGSIVALLLLTCPELFPAAMSQGQFTTIARIVNSAGGLLYLLAAIRLLADYDSTDSKSYLVFANLCLLSGVSGLLFQSSNLWDAGWWFWHALRLAGYLLLLAYLIGVYHRTHADMSKLSKQLSGKDSS